MVGLETSSTSSGSGSRGQKHRGRKKANGVVNGIDSVELTGLSDLSNAALEAKHAHVQLEAKRLELALQRVEHELADRSELSRAQGELHGANALISQLEADLHQARREAAHAADQLRSQHEADKRQWHSEQQQRDAELQSVMQQLRADLAEQSTELHAARDDLKTGHQVITATRSELEGFREKAATEARQRAELQKIVTIRDAELEEVVRRGEALCEEKEHVMTVLAEWQHYGRTRNTDFENALKAVQQKDHEIGALKHQIAARVILPRVPQLPHPPALQADVPTATHNGNRGQINSSQMNSTGSTQLGTSPRGGQPPRQGLPQQAGDAQLPAPLQPPSAQRDFLEQKIIAALRQLLPVSESDAVAVTPAFEAELDVRLAPLTWGRDVGPYYGHGNVFDFLVERQTLFLRRRVDGWWYMPQRTLPAPEAASLQAFFPSEGFEAEAQNLTPRDAPVAAPPAGGASAAITRPSPNGHQRSAAPPGFSQKGVPPSRRQHAKFQHARPVNPAELAVPLQQLALQQQHEQQRQEQASKQPDPVPAPSSSSGGRVIVTPLHPEGLKLMEERRRQSVDTPTEPARKPSQPAVLTVPRLSSRSGSNVGVHADPQRRAGHKVQRQESGVSASSGHNPASETASIADSSGAPKRHKGRKRNKGNRGDVRPASSPAEERAA